MIPLCGEWEIYCNSKIKKLAHTCFFNVKYGTLFFTLFTLSLNKINSMSRMTKKQSKTKKYGRLRNVDTNSVSTLASLRIKLANKSPNPFVDIDPKFHSFDCKNDD